jgi:hypothetical protein
VALSVLTRSVTVHNIEVEGISVIAWETKGFVYNQSAITNCCTLWPVTNFAGYPDRRTIRPTQVIVGGPFNGQRRAPRIEARLRRPLPLGQRPSCWPPGIRPGLQLPGLPIVVRAHLLGEALGGPGICDNLVPACQRVNQAMFTLAESIVLARVLSGREVATTRLKRVMMRLRALFPQPSQSRPSG